MRKKVLVAFTTLLFTLTGALCACSQNDTPKTPEVESVTLSEEAMALYVGDEKTLEAKILPDTASDKSVKWYAGDENIVTVNNGKIKAIATGYTFVLAKSNDGGLTDSCTIKVYEKATDVRLDKSELTMVVGVEQTLVPTVTPSTSVDDLVWSCEPVGIVSVNKGKIMPLIEGNAVVKVSTADGSKSAICNITVKACTKDIILSSENLNDDELTLLFNESEEVSAKIIPDNAMQGVKWSSDNSQIANVDENGKITAGTVAGKTNITATSEDGVVSKTIKVTVFDPSVVDNITFEKSSYNVLKGSTNEKLAVKFMPEESATGKTIEFNSSNQNIATISNDGTITALNYGRTTITAKVGEKQATCEVIVTRFADSTGLVMHYNEQDGTLQNVTINSDNIAQRVNTFATGDGQGSYVYYAEATFNGISLKDFTGGTTGIGMIHAVNAVNSKETNKDFLFDKINSYIFNADNNSYGMWYRQGIGYDVSDNDLLYNVDMNMLGTFGTTMKKTFTEQTSLKYGIARDNNYIYTFINDVMMLKRVIPSELKNKATYAGIYTDCCAEEGHYIDNITYLDGEEALQKINSADRSFVLSRNEGNEVKFGENNKSFTLTGKGNWWATSVTPTEFFDANVTIDFDLTHTADTEGHIIFNIVGNEEQFKGNTDKTDIKAANNTVVAYSMWTNATGTQVNGVDVYPDTTTGYNDKANRDYVEFAKNDGVLHYTIKLSMDENGLVTSVITVKAGETIIATATKTTTKAWNNKDLSIHFLAGEKVGYTVSNFIVTKDSNK